MSRLLSTERLDAAFGANPLRVERLVHRPSGRTVCEGGTQRLLLRLPKRPSDPVHLTDVSDAEAAEGGFAFTAADETGAFRARVHVSPTATGLRYRLAVSAPEPVWMAEWMLGGLDLDEVVVPALGGQVLTRAMPASARLAYKYPFWWNAQFALGTFGGSALGGSALESGEEGGIWLRTTEVAPRFKVLRVHRPEDGFVLGLGFEADAPVEATTLEAEWTLEGYAGAWSEPVAAHRRWLAGAFDLVPFAEHPHLPAWAAEIDFVLEVWGMRNDLGRPGHTFDETVERLEHLARLHPPERTLLYLPGYAEEGVDSRIPDYAPSAKLGGAEGLRRLVDAAHRLGARVMIHTNVLGMTYSHPRFPDFAEHQVVDPFGQKLGWGNDLDGDWLPEPYFAYINPGAAAWGDLMEATLGGLIADFDLDAVFLDQTLLAFNDSRGPNFVEGMRGHVRRLQTAFPHVLFAGEGLHEQVLPVLPFVQIHGIDSLAEVHGTEGQADWRRVHPVSTTLFGPYARFAAHLLTQHPSSPDFARQEAAYDALGVVPGLVLYDRSQPLDTPETHAMLARARGLRSAAPSIPPTP